MTLVYDYDVGRIILWCWCCVGIMALLWCDYVRSM